MSYTIEERDAAIEKAQKAVDKATEGRNGALERLRAHDETLGRALFRLRVAQIMPVEGVTPIYGTPCVHDNPDEKRGVELVLPDHPGIEQIAARLDAVAAGALAARIELPSPLKFADEDNEAEEAWPLAGAAAAIAASEEPPAPGHVNWTTVHVDALPGSSLRAVGTFDNAAEHEERVATDCTGPLPEAAIHDARVAADALAYEAKQAVNPFAGAVVAPQTVVNPFASAIDAAAQAASRAAAQAVPGDVDLATALPEEKRARVEAALAAARAEQPIVNPFAGG